MRQRLLPAVENRNRTIETPNRWWRTASATTNAIRRSRYCHCAKSTHPTSAAAVAAARARPFRTLLQRLRPQRLRRCPSPRRTARTTALRRRRQQTASRGPARTTHRQSALPWQLALRLRPSRERAVEAETQSQAAAERTQTATAVSPVRRRDRPLPRLPPRLRSALGRARASQLPLQPTSCCPFRARSFAAASASA